MVQTQTDIPPGRIDAALNALDTLASESLAKTGVPGMAIAVVHHDQQIFARGYGVRAAGTSDAVDADTVFRLASVSKPLASTVTAGLVGDGHVSWDARIGDIDPAIEMFDPWVTRELTIRDLLCHRSGMPEYGSDHLVDLGFDRATIFHRLRYLRPDSSFRSHYAYNNITYSLGHVAAAGAAGMLWEDACVERLYKPLGMARTSTRYADFLATPNRAIEHQRIEGKWVHNGPSEDDAAAPAGNVSSSVNDMSRWLRLQLGMGMFEGRQLIAAEALGETHRPQIANNRPPDPNIPTGFYGLGWNVGITPGGQVQLSHSGAFFMGAGTTVYMVPAAQLGIVVLSNAFPIGLVEAMAVSFLDLVANGTLSRDWLELYMQGLTAVFQAFVDKVAPYDYSAPPAIPTPALPAAAYAGSYDNDLYGPATVVEQGGSLVLQYGPRPLTYPLAHYDRDIFIYQPGGENSPATSGARFTIGPGGQAIEVLLDNLNMFGQGSFTRMPDAT